MSEWLTIWQLIDQLKPGETATDENEEYTVSWKHSLFFEDEDRNVHKDIILSYKCLIWHILSKYAPLEEAMKALKDG
ncbi:hypothetical protein [Domibacillus aminovorans]|uniref:Uncharacterized protein n=1 Tax=Domibacillus aminovorans TaxID=29332 RepID=A0A177L4I1_9BACI|nr:hypothetical protein [Domibacillus aminovorans]OAH60463.1 hypothetical protein AWH49_16515 [Domibacillus aminovorans]